MLRFEIRWFGEWASNSRVMCSGVCALQICSLWVLNACIRMQVLRSSQHPSHPNVAEGHGCRRPYAVNACTRLQVLRPLRVAFFFGRARPPRRSHHWSVFGFAWGVGVFLRVQVLRGVGRQHPHVSTIPPHSSEVRLFFGLSFLFEQSGGFGMVHIPHVAIVKMHFSSVASFCGSGSHMWTAQLVSPRFDVHFSVCMECMCFLSAHEHPLCPTCAIRPFWNVVSGSTTMLTKQANQFIVGGWVECFLVVRVAVRLFSNAVLRFVGWLKTFGVF